MNIIQIFKQFPTQESCIEHLEYKRWGGGKAICPYCESKNTNHLIKQSRHHCNGCRKTFSVTVGTIFHDTKVPLQKWFLLIALMLSAKKGLSACQAARDIELRRPTVWSMMHRIRKAMQDDGTLLTGIIEMDETYIGGKPRKGNKHDKDDDDINNTPLNKRGRGTSKIPVVGQVERGGNVKAFKMSKDCLGAKDLEELVRKNVDTKQSVLISDYYKAYNRISKILRHYKINHSQNYVNGNIHTNTIESFWALVKRGIVGQFHRVSGKYLNRYLDEFCYRYNARNTNISIVFDRTMQNMLGC